MTGERFRAHGQFTYVEQQTSGFTAPYRGPNSLSPRIGAETVEPRSIWGRVHVRARKVWLNAEMTRAAAS